MGTSKVSSSKVDDANERPTVHVSWYEPGVLEVAWAGQVDGAVVAEALKKAKQIRSNAPVRAVIVNAQEVLGYRVDLRTPSTQFMEYFRDELAVKEFVGIMPNGAVRMFARAMALATRMKFPVFSTRKEAESYLHSGN